MADRTADGKVFLINLVLMKLHRPGGCFTEVTVMMPILRRRNWSMDGWRKKVCLMSPSWAGWRGDPRSPGSELILDFRHCMSPVKRQTCKCLSWQIGSYGYVVITNATPRQGSVVQKWCFSKSSRLGAWFICSEAITFVFLLGLLPRGPWHCWIIPSRSYTLVIFIKWNTYVNNQCLAVEKTWQEISLVSKGLLHSRMHALLESRSLWLFS